MHANQSMLMCFVDLKKAYDSVNREALWKVMETYNVPLDIIQRIRDLHVDNEVQVRAFGGISDKFKVNSGVRQGCVLAPTLFNVFMDFVIKKALKEENNFPKGIRFAFSLNGRLKWIDGNFPAEEYINILLYADDIVLLMENVDDLKVAVAILEKVCKEAGLVISTKKTEIMTVGGKAAALRRRGGGCLCGWGETKGC